MLPQYSSSLTQQVERPPYCRLYISQSPWLRTHIGINWSHNRLGYGAIGRSANYLKLIGQWEHILCPLHQHITWYGCCEDHVKGGKLPSGGQASHTCLGIIFIWFLHINNLQSGWNHLVMFLKPSPPFFPMYGELIKENMHLRDL